MPRIQLIVVYALVGVALGAVAGALLGATRPGEYVSTATLAVDGGGYDELLAPNGVSFDPRRVVESRLADRADGLLAVVPPEDRAVQVYRLAKLDAVAELASQRSEARFSRDDLDETVEPGVDRDLGVVFITATTDDAGEAAERANVYASALVAYVDDGQAAELQRLQDRLARVREEAARADVPARERRRLEREVDVAAAQLRVVDPLLGEEPPVRTVFTAQAPESSSSAPVLGYILGGALVGLLLGVLAALARLWRTASARRWTADPTGALDAPVLAELPLLGGPDPLGERSADLAAALDARLDQAGARSVAVSSPRGDDATTSVAWALASTWAASGRRVLLVDGRTQRADADADPADTDVPGGLAALDELAGAAPADYETAKQRAVERVALPAGGAADQVAAGGDDRTADDLASDGFFKRFLAESAETYDRVVLEAPPGPAASPLTALTDGAVVVARGGKVTGLAIRRQLRRLRGKGSTVFGLVVVRDADEPDPRDGDSAGPPAHERDGAADERPQREPSVS
jgi:receptor protein-tyrosine kinase